MIDRKALQADLKKLTSRLVDDLRERAEKDTATAAHLLAEYQKAKDAGRTALAYEAWREDPLTQGAVAWVLSCVFVRFLEDIGLLDDGGGVPRRLLAAADPALRPLADGLSRSGATVRSRDNFSLALSVQGQAAAWMALGELAASFRTDAARPGT